jgi:hypothetical protein
MTTNAIITRIPRAFAPPEVREAREYAEPAMLTLLLSNGARGCTLRSRKVVTG